MSYLDRMVDELNELNTKVTKLNAFFSTTVFAGLSANHQTLLERQYSGMVEYKLALEQRVDLTRSEL